MRNGHVFIDRFSVGLDELSRKQQADISAVLEVLHDNGRFSAFEASDNDVIGKTMTAICHNGYVETKDAGYPWTKVKLTAKGLAMIGRNVIALSQRNGSDE